MNNNEVDYHSMSDSIPPEILNNNKTKTLYTYLDGSITKKKMPNKPYRSEMETPLFMLIACKS